MDCSIESIPSLIFSVQTLTFYPSKLNRSYVEEALAKIIFLLSLSDGNLKPELRQIEEFGLHWVNFIGISAPVRYVFYYK
jgi:hypothetical protein